MRVIEIKPHIRTIIVNRRPRSLKQTVEAITTYWKEHEIDIPLNDVLREDKIFWNIRWAP